MILNLHLKWFRKHEDTKIDFTSGLNVLRGPNEVGKTTITEGILYCGYGASALVDKLEEVVTWGHKESELWGRMEIRISHTTYTFTRSKAGAECNYKGADGVALKVTGQKEVSAFFAGLMGADAKTASVLMLSSQAGLRGALDDGATAVSALMGKLADFDLIDRILKNADATLALGSAQPVKDKLVAAEAAVLEAMGALVQQSTIDDLSTKVGVATLGLEASTVGVDAATVAVNEADTARTNAQSNNTSYGVAQQTVANLKTTQETERSRLLAAEADAAKKVDQTIVAALTAQVAAAKNHKAELDLYLKFQSIPKYPDIAWDEDKASFDAAMAASCKKRDDLKLQVRECDSDITALKKRIISGDGKCPSCGHVAENHDHVIAANAQIAVEIAALEENKAKAGELLVTELNDIAVMDGIRREAERRQEIIDKVAGRITVDVSVYPSKVTWSGAVPGMNAPNVTAIELQIATLAQQERLATQAEGRVQTHKVAITDQEAAVARVERVVAMMSLVDLAPLQQAYEAAYVLYTEAMTKQREFRDMVDALTMQKQQAEYAAASAKSGLVAAQLRVAEYTRDIEVLSFNNELVKKLKSMKPMITDHLWNSVLAAVSNFFSTLRGEQSIVTKDASGFRVNGRTGSLSGSTLDMLALAIRVALSKTFVPHANFLVLDEPAHGCDETRTTNLLGFLAGVGFAQTILASHDEVSEAVADNIINLGT